MANSAIQLQTARILAGISMGVEGVAGIVFVSEIVENRFRPIMGIFPGVLGTGGKK